MRHVDPCDLDLAWAGDRAPVAMDRCRKPGPELGAGV